MEKPNKADTILIVDDNLDIIEFLSAIFMEQYEVLTATNGADALELLNEQRVSLIISDIMMPGIDGFALCQQIKADVSYCHIPIILLTAKNTFKAQMDGLEAGADAYVQKPFSPKFLQLNVTNLLSNRAKVKEHFASSPFADSRVIAHSKTDEIFLKKLDEYIQENMKNVNLDINLMADQMNMSRSTFYRKIKSISSLSPKELLDVTRLKKAAQLLSENNHKVYEISRLVGYSSQSILGKAFQRHFGVSPMDYLAQLKKEV